LRKLFLCSLIVAAAAATTNSEAADKWLSIRSKNFVLVGNASESSIRHVGRTLEEFRAGVALIFPSIAQQTSPPITVLVFKDDASFRPFKPLYQGKPANVAGYFQTGQDADFIALTADTETPRVIYHEFVHALTKDTATPLPPWASEGIAEVYSTFEIESNGKEMLLGRAIAEHLQTLQTKSLPLNSLFAVDRASPDYNEQTKQGIFYAESWAVMHYLMLANDRQRHPQLVKFITLLGNGKTIDENFREAFQTDPARLEKELQDYIRRFAFPAVRFKLQSKIDFDHEVEVSPLTEAQGQYYLGDLLAHTGRNDAAETQLQKAISLDPNYGPSYAALGILRVRQGKSDEALQFLTRAVQADSTNYMVHYYYASMLQTVGSNSKDSAGSRLPLMREHLKKAVELAPDYAPAYDMLGYVALVSREELPQTEDILKKALNASPGKRQLRLRLAELMLANNETLAARVTVSSLKNVSDDEVVQRRAEGLLDQIEKRIQAESAVREYNDRQRATEQARGQAAAAVRDSVQSKEPDGPPKIRYAQTAQPANDTTTETTARPIVRPAGRQIEGSLLLIDCSQGMTLRVRIANNVNVELHSDDPSKIEFVSYSAAVSGSFTCGQFKSDTPVLIVYGDSSNSRYLGEPLRVEFTRSK
jgi:tetratricopeptide (TPR) repeat protein